MNVNDAEVQAHMTFGFVTAEPHSSLAEVISSMLEATTSCLIVVTDDKPVGIITERDMLKVLANEKLGDAGPKNLSAGDIMSPDPITVTYHASLKEAFVISQSYGVRNLPVIDDDGYLMGLLGQSDIVSAHFNLLDELRTLSMEDSLLGIGNRRAMEMDLNYTHANAKRYQRYYTLVLVDVDFFKKYNDHYGHQKGDEALQLVTKAIRSGVRSSDRVYRYGGEELLILLPETYPLVGSKVVERVLQIIRNKQEPHVESEIGVLTVSAGLSAFEPGCGKGWEEIMKEADEQLYLSKQRGRNCVSWSGDQDSITAAAV